MPSKRGRPALEASAQTFEVSTSSSENGVVLHSSPLSSRTSSSLKPANWLRKRASGVGEFLTNAFSPSRKRLKIETHGLPESQLRLTNGPIMTDSASNTPPASGFVEFACTAAEASTSDTQLLLSSQEGVIRDPLGRVALRPPPSTGHGCNIDNRSSSEDAAESQIQHTSPPSSPAPVSESESLQQDARLRKAESTDHKAARSPAGENHNHMHGPVPTDADVDHIQAVAEAKVGHGVEGPLEWLSSPVDEAPHTLSASAFEDGGPSEASKTAQTHAEAEIGPADIVDLVSDSSSDDSSSQNNDPDKENDVSLATPLLDSRATMPPFPSDNVSWEPARVRRSRYSFNGPLTNQTQRKLVNGRQNDVYADSTAQLNGYEIADTSAIEEVRLLGRQTSFMQPKRRNGPRTSTPLQSSHMASRDRSFSFSSDVSMLSVSAISHKTRSSGYRKREPIFGKRHKNEVDRHNEASIKRKIGDALRRINVLRSSNRKPLLDPKQFEQLAKKTVKVHLLNAQDNAKEDMRADAINDLLQRFLRQKELDAQTAILPLPAPKLQEKERMEREKRARMRKLRGVLGRQALPDQLEEEEEEAARVALSKRGVVSSITGAEVIDKDVQKLRPGQWLNDEVINFYGTLILNRANEADKKRTEAMKAIKYSSAPAAADTNGTMGRKKGKAESPRPYDTSLDAYWRVHYFSSFFWTNLKSKGFDGVKRWTRRIDIFSKDIILFPINVGNSHWVCGAINMRKHRFEYYDSLGARNSSAFTLMRTYVSEEARDKKKKEIDLRGWTDLFSNGSPRQENGYDCGVFASQTLEQISRRGSHTPIPLDAPSIVWKDDTLDEGAGKMNIAGADGSGGYESDDEDYEWNFEQHNMPYLRKRMACEIYSKQLLD